MAGQAELQTAVDALKVSEDALIQRIAANAQAAETRAKTLQDTIDALKAQNAPELQPQIDALNALKAEADAAAQAPAPEPAPVVV